VLVGSAAARRDVVAIGAAREGKQHSRERQDDHAPTIPLHHSTRARTRIGGDGPSDHVRPSMRVLRHLAPLAQASFQRLSDRSRTSFEQHTCRLVAAPKRRLRATDGCDWRAVEQRVA
jgi:hypothetical protein